MEEVKLFNTLTRTLETLSPKKPGEVSLYCCGPTVYNYQHIGNLRTYIFEDLLVRTLRYTGYKTQHVMNITDVGHLVSDADDGQDKMLVAAKREGKTSEEIANFYTEIFFEHCRWLNIQKPDVVCKATEHIAQMIALIERLEARGIAYQSGGNVYFDVSKCEDYGKLAGLDLAGLQAGARIEVDQLKKNPLDFALWFTKSKFEGQELQWDSPWGRGYPGWHIECSAMAMHYLGESFDIHCGGIDHIPVHHTNEIAQSECATGVSFAAVWLHGGFLVLGKDKMSKSTGEFLTLDVLKERGFDPMSYRLFCLSAGYGGELSWSWQALEGAANSLKKIKQQFLAWPEPTPESELSQEALNLKDTFMKAVTNNLNMPSALAVLHQVSNSSTLASSEKRRLLLNFDAVFGLDMQSWREELISIPDEISTLAAAREAARKAKDFKKADEIRDQILELGYTLEDTPQGPKVKSKDL